MTTTTARTKGFSLLEVIVASAISIVVLTATMSAFIQLMKANIHLADYGNMEIFTQRIISHFGADARQASDSAWGSSTSVTFTVNGAPVRYEYDSANKTFTRTAGGTTTTEASNVTSVAFKVYNLSGSPLPLETSASTVGATAKMVQLRITLLSRGAAETATETINSACFILRNKDV